MENMKKRVISKSTSTNKEENEIPKSLRSPSKRITLKVLSRMVVACSLLIVVYYSCKNNKVKTIAKQTDVLSGVVEIVKCSPDYMKEVDKYEGCFPRHCKRFVTDEIVTMKEADELLYIAKKGFKLGGSSGGASILDLHSGALSKSQYFINIYKTNNNHPFTENDFSIYKIIKEKIKFAVAHQFGVQPDKIYLTHPTFFSEITSKEAVTVHDEYWHPHVDKETYKSFHYTTLLYLGDYNIDFKGGRFVFVDKTANKTVEPRKGRLSMFTSGSENLHYVEKVTSGKRYAVTISFTCDKQFAIDDPSINKYK